MNTSNNSPLTFDGTGTIVTDCNEDAVHVVIPEGVTAIGYGAFLDCKSLTSIEIPNSVTAIWESAFSGCTSLTSIEIPNSVTAIEDWAFDECSSLTSIEIPNSVTAIGKGALYGCESLTSIEIPNSVTAIGDGAFWGCESLTSIEIPNSVTSIGERAFGGCESLTSIVIPKSVTAIGYHAFYNCTSLTSIEIPKSLRGKISEDAFRGCFISSKQINEHLATERSGSVYVSSFRDASVEACFGVTNLADCFVKDLDSIALGNESNFCMVGICGPWGRGKSYFFERVRDIIEERNLHFSTIRKWIHNIKRTEKYKVVQFNAWKYCETPALWAYLFETIYKNISWFIRLRFRLQYNIVLNSIFVFIISAIVAFSIIQFANLPFANPFAAYKDSIWSKLSSFPGWDSPSLWTSLSIGSFFSLFNYSRKFYKVAGSIMKDLSKDVPFKSSLGTQAEVEKSLIHLLKIVIGRFGVKRKRLLLYIEDLDRCEPENMVDIVESLRVVLENEELRKRLVIVCSLDIEKLKIGLRSKYQKYITRDASNEDNFQNIVNEQLDKLFISVIGLPKLTPEQVCEYVDILPKDHPTSVIFRKADDSALAIQNSDNQLLRDIKSRANSEEQDPAHPLTEEHPQEEKSQKVEKVKIDDRWLAEQMKEVIVKNQIELTPRKARIIYYRLLLAKNIFDQTKPGAQLMDTLVEKIVLRSTQKDYQLNPDEALSDLVEIVAPY